MVSVEGFRLTAEFVNGSINNDIHVRLLRQNEGNEREYSIPYNVKK